MNCILLSLLAASALVRADVDVRAVTGSHGEGDKAGQYLEPLFKPQKGMFYDSEGREYEGSMNDLPGHLLNKRVVNCNSRSTFSSKIA